MISVIIPVYNEEPFLERCLDSLANQTDKSAQVIIVDDGSTDNTLSICKALAEKDARIKIFEGEHKGVSAARNIALDNAEGEYVFFLDSDDTVHPLLFEALVKGMQDSGAEISGSCCFPIRQINWHKLDKAKAKYPAPAELEFLDNAQAVEAVFNGGTPLNLIGGCMMHRDLISDTRFNTDIYIGEDFLFVYENLIKSEKVAFLKQKWYYERIHDSNTSWDWGFNGFLTRFNRRLLVAESEKRLGRMEFSNKQTRDAFAIFIYCQGKNKLNSPDAKKMRKHIKKYNKTFLPLFTFKAKIAYILAVYFPHIYYLVLKLHKKVG